MAKQDLDCADFISRYPIDLKLNYNPSESRDNFYKYLCNLLFNNSLVIISTLLDNDPKCISFYNWKEFYSDLNFKSKLRTIKKEFQKSGFQIIRDQVVGHIDKNNINNKFPLLRNQSIINEHLIKNLMNLLNKLIFEFHEYTNLIKSPYQDLNLKYNSNLNELKEIFQVNPPKMTNNTVI